MAGIVAKRLDFPHEDAEALLRIAAIEPEQGAFNLPSDAQARQALTRLGVSPDAIDECVASLDLVRERPEVLFLLERMHHELMTQQEGAPLWWPVPRPSADPVDRFFQLYVFIVALPHALSLHEARSIPPKITWATLRDITLGVEAYRRENNRPGFGNAFWLSQHFRCGIFQLGRLQFNFWKVVFDPPAGAGFGEGDPAIGVHIPALGPLTREACEASFEQARAFFPRHFPDKGPFRVATCGSWLLDEQLEEYLPESSNIIRFQRMFERAPNWHLPGNDDVMRFVFGYVPQSLDELPQRTTLERAIVDHIKSGRSWRIRNGWILL